MDYEKAYKHALRLARSYYGKGTNEFLDTIFPELAESEDEKMVKAIEHILYENYSDAAIIEDVEIAEIVNWLEKHKEQKPEPFSCGHENGYSEKPNTKWSEDEKTAREIKEFILYKAGYLLDEDTEHRFVEYLKRQKVNTDGDFASGYDCGYEKAEQDIISLIESRIAEILGDAQPAPVLRIELQELIDKIKEESK